MLGLLLIYFLGKAFYDLAEEYDRPPWGYAILGVASYYIGTFIGGIVIALGLELSGHMTIDEMDDLALNFIALPFGLLTSYFVYWLLNRRWKNAVLYESPDDLLDDLF